MLMAIIKIIPTIFPFLKELFTSSKRNRGGGPPKKTARVVVGCIIIVVVTLAVTYDFTVSVYRENHDLKVTIEQFDTKTKSMERTISSLERTIEKHENRDLIQEREISELLGRLSYYHEAEARKAPGSNKSNK